MPSYFNDKKGGRDNGNDTWRTSSRESDRPRSGDRGPYNRYGNSDSWRSRGGSRQGSYWGSKPPQADLPPVPFEKNFYTEKPHITEMSNAQVEEFRRKNEMRIKGENVPKPLLEFKDAPFPEKALKEFEMRGYATPTPIQAQGWPMALSGRDMVGIAQTGSGKTISFALPALIHAKSQEPLRRGDGPVVLILAPTRELCLQIQEEIDTYARYFRLTTHAVYGGVSPQPQKQALLRGVEVLVATPGRLIDLHEQGFAPLKRVTFLVLDEADRMLDMGFEPQLCKIIPQTNPERQTLMWSATWPAEVRELARNYMHDYIQVNIGSEDLTSNAKITQKIEVVEYRRKKDALLHLLRSAEGRTIVFCNMKRTCDDLEYVLMQESIRVAAIHGDKSQAIRDRVIQDFKSGRCTVLLATDVAARGLDVKDVKMVVNYDFPNNCEDYVHRIGRTARGNVSEGKAVTLFTEGDRNNAKDLVKVLSDAKQEVPRELRDLVGDSDAKRYSRYGGYNRSRNFSRRW
jgi:ATP-dependent RNA helicase DDX5/DBP2